MPKSLRARLILASGLWTLGLLFLLHVVTFVLMHVAPAVLRFRAWQITSFGVVLMTMGLIGFRQGLAPFHRLRTRLGAARAGPDERVTGAYPTEVQPLIDDLNGLLDERDRAVRRAVAAAGDLAHGLKTPLALLAQEAVQARASGNAELADAIDQQVERMSRQINYHLARARAAASWVRGSEACAIAPCVEALARTLSKLYAGRALEIASNVAPDLQARVQVQDLDEILGNLLDNACKWARSRIAVNASTADSNVVITVEDDGPGLDPALQSAVLERGVRADEAAPGSGLGLAIVRELTELYGGSVSLSDSRMGGLHVTVRLPSSRDTA